MKEKRINELSDEALDEVTGGATYHYNEGTGKYDVISKNKKYVASYDTEEEARKATWEYTKTEPLRWHIVDTSGSF